MTDRASPAARPPATVRIATWSARHRWPVAGLWFVFCLGLLVASVAMGGIRTEDATGSADDAKTEAAKAYRVFIAAGREEPSERVTLVLTHPSLKASDPAYRARVGEILRRLGDLRVPVDGRDVRVLEEIVDPYRAPPHAGLLSPDGSAVRLGGTVVGDGEVLEAKMARLRAELDGLRSSDAQFALHAVSRTLINEDIEEVVNEDLDGSLRISLPLTFAILLIAFGAVVAAALPLVLAVTALVASFGIIGLYSQFVIPVSPYATQLIVLIGLAVGVDYSLFMLSRFRTERRRGRDRLAAIEVASSTAGRAVFFSGLAVMISLAGLFLLDDPIFRSMAIGTIAVVLVAVVGSLTFLPAALAILGDRVNALRVPFFGREREEGSGFWAGLVRRVMRRPLILGGLIAALLLAMSYPVLHLRLGQTDITSFPESIDGVRALRVLDEKWPQGATLQLQVAVTEANRTDTRAAIARLRAAALRVPGVGEPVEVTPSADQSVALVSFTLAGSQNDARNWEIVRAMRTEVVPAVFAGVPGVEAYVTGDAAAARDTTTFYTDAMPLVFTFVLGLSFLLLLVAFHSIAIPLKAIVLNLLSTGAAYGVLVLVFQEGWFSDVLGVRPTGVIESFVPVFIFTILFGLSMDYHVFILTRVKEARDRGTPSNEAVARGIAITSGTITSAAAIMVVVFAVFATLQLVVIRQLGLGLAVAIFVDATVVRSVLLPATMRLLGDWNWWMPRFLDWIPRVTIEGEAQEPGAAG